jgi:hypothetical protein
MILGIGYIARTASGYGGVGGKCGRTDAHLRLHPLELFCIHLEGLALLSVLLKPPFPAR